MQEKRVVILSGPRKGLRGKITRELPKVPRWWHERIEGPVYVILIGMKTRICESIHNVRLDQESSPEKRQRILEEGIQKSIEDTAFVQSSQNASLRKE